MSALREIAVWLGVEFDDTQLKKGTQSISGAVDKLKAFGAMIAGNAIVKGIFEFADSFQEAASRVVDTAGSLGVTTDELQALSFAAGLGGVSVEQMTGALTKLSVNASAAAHGGKAQAAAFHALGVSVRGASGHVRPVTEILNDTASALGRIEDPARRAQLAQQLFGKSTRNLLNMMHDGPDGVAALTAEFKELGGGFSPAALKAADAYGDEMERFWLVARGLRGQLALELLPAMTAGLQTIRGWGVAFLRMAKNSQIVKAALLTLGIVGVLTAAEIILAWLPVLLPLAAMAAVIAVIVLVVDDLLVLIGGGDSLIGRFVERFIGIGAASTLVAGLKEAWAGLNLMFHDAVATLPLLWDSIKTGAGSAWDWIQEKTGAVVQWIDDHTAGIFRPYLNSLREALAIIGRLIMRIPGMQSLVSGLSGAVSGIGQDWRELPLNQSPGGAVQQRRGNFASVSANTPASARSTVVHQANPTTIHVNGARDPQAVAREVVDRQQAVQRANARDTGAALQRTTR